MAIPTLSWQDHLRFLGFSFLRWVLGLAVPNRWSLALFARVGVGRRLSGFSAGLSSRYGSSHVWADFPRKRILIVLCPVAIEHVLASTRNTADPAIKTASISKFAPNSLVVSTHPQWDARRPFNEWVLGFGHRPPSLLRHEEAFASIVNDAVAQLLPVGERLRWSDFESLAQRVSQQVLFGAGACVPEMAARMSGMVAAGNFFVARTRERERFDRELRSRLTACAPESLAADAASCVAATGREPAIDVPAQFTFWFFVLRDALELHVARTLLLIASRRSVLRKAKNEAQGAGTPCLRSLPWLEACLRESLRLWTPVPLLVRRATESFELPGGVILNTNDWIFIDAASYHRDPRFFPKMADRFSPVRAAGASFPNVYYFSGGHQACAGQHLALPLITNTVAALLRRFENLSLVRPQIDPCNVPHLIDHYSLQFKVT